MGRGKSRGALLLCFLLVLLAGAWLSLSRSVGRGAQAARAQAEPVARGRATERVEARLEQPLLPEPAALGREEVSAPGPGEERPAFDAFENLASDEGLLQIRVITIETRRPMRDVVLRLEVPRGARRGAARAPRELVSNAQGRVDCRVPADTECLLSTLRGAASHPLRWKARPVPAGEIRTVVVQLFASPDLPWYARAVDAGTGAPLPDARAALVEHDPLVEPDILLAVEAEPDGMLRLECSSSRESFVRIEAPGRSTRVLEIRSGHEQRESAALVELSLAAALEVSVTDPQGAPVGGLDAAVSCPRAALMLESEPGESWMADDPTWQARTSPAGRARIDGLPPLTALTLMLSSEGKPVHQAMLEAGLDPGRTVSLRVELGSGRTLAGRTQRPDGEPRTRVGLWLLPARDGERYLDWSMQERVFQRTESDEQGRFRFEDVPAGRWFVGPEPERDSVRAGRNSFLVFAEDAGAADARARGIAPVAEEVTLQGDAPVGELSVTCWSDLYISGQIVGPENGDFTLVHARGEGMALLASAYFGTFRLGPLAPGRYELTATCKGAASPAVVAEAGTEGLVLRLLPAPGRAERAR